MDEYFKNLVPSLGASAIPDPPDERDYRFYDIPDEDRILSSSSSLPRSVSWESELTSPKYQGRLGCHDIKTEILTENGWKLFKDVEKGVEKVATVNQETKEIEYQTPTNYIEYDYDGEMFYFNHKNGLNCLVTPNHKMYVRKWNTKDVTLNEDYELVEASDIGWYSGLLTSLKWEENSPECIKMPDVKIGWRKNAEKESERKGEEIKTEDFVSFLGLYFAEGCCYRPEGTGSYRIEIAASDNNVRKEKVVEIIDNLPYKYTVYHDRVVIWNKSLFSFLKPFGNVYSKRVPRFVMNLNKKDILLFLYGYLLGDGSFHKDGARTGYSVSEGLIDDMQELMLKTGRYSRKKIRKPRINVIRGREVHGKESYELYERIENTKLSIDRNRHLSKIPYRGKVYCVEVPNHILITRREGVVLVSGNSCIAFATCGLKEWQETKEHKKEVEDGKEDHREQKDYNFSEQWVYWNCKKIDPWPNSEGTNYRSAFKVLQKIGVPTEEAWPYSDDKLNIGKPKGWASLIARWATIGSYWNVGRGLQELKRALVEGPVCISFPCFAEMYGYIENGFVPYPKDPSKIYAYHAILATGYDDDKGIISIKNSWSQFWGRRGYGDFPYSYIDDFLGSAWMVKDISVTLDMLVGTRNLIE